MTDEARELFRLRDGLNIVVTIGNSFRRDDGAGPFIASGLKEAQKITVIDAGTTPELYVEKIIAYKPSYILFIDAADFKGRAGEVKSIGKNEISDYTLSTHSFPLRAVWEIIEQSIPVEIRIAGIQPLDISFGEGLTENVMQTAQEIVEMLNA